MKTPRSPSAGSQGRARRVRSASAHPRAPSSWSGRGVRTRRAPRPDRQALHRTPPHAGRRLLRESPPVTWPAAIGTSAAHRWRAPDAAPRIPGSRSRSRRASPAGGRRAKRSAALSRSPRRPRVSRRRRTPQGPPSPGSNHSELRWAPSRAVRDRPQTADDSSVSTRPRPRAAAPTPLGRR